MKTWSRIVELPLFRSASHDPIGLLDWFARCRAILLFALPACWTGLCTAAPPSRTADVRLILFPGGARGSGGGQPLQIEIAAAIDQKALKECSNQTADKVFDFFDFNHDGWLDQDERSRLPSAIDLRQLAWGRMIPSGRPDPTWTALKGNLARSQFKEIFNGLGGSGLSVAYGKVPGTQALHLALLGALDANKDGNIDEKEWKEADRRLAAFDRNGDGLVSPGELVRGRVYPGVSATTLIEWRDLTKRSGRGDSAWSEIPLIAVRLPFSTKAQPSANEDGRAFLDAIPAAPILRGPGRSPLEQITAEELAKMIQRPADARFEAHWSSNLPSEKKDHNLVFSDPLVHVDLRMDPGQFAGQFAGQRAQLEGRFVESDALKSGKIGVKDLAAQHTDLERVLEVADADQDHLLSRKELDRWLALQGEIAQGQLLFGILDYDRGLFEFLDRDQDGGLSVPELKSAWDRVRALGCWKEGKVSASALPWNLRMTISRGQPRDKLRPGGSLAGDRPAWFMAMDRNGDGVLSQTEFLGPLSKFKKCDENNDGLLTPAEAQRLTRDK